MIVREKLRRAVALAASRDAPPLLRLDELRSAEDDGASVQRAERALERLRAEEPAIVGGSGGAMAARAGSGCFDAVYINLRERTDRRRELERQLGAAALSARRLDARTAAPSWAVARMWDSELNGRFDWSCAPREGVPLSMGERGCAYSHALLWARCAARPLDAPPMLILEDDVEFAPNCAKRCAALVDAIERAMPPPARRALLYLGADVARWRGRAVHRLSSPGSDAPPKPREPPPLGFAPIIAGEEPLLQAPTPARRAGRPAKPSGQASPLDGPYQPGGTDEGGGGFGDGGGDGRGGDCLREAAYLWHTSAYVLWPEGARRLLQLLPIPAPVDVSIAKLVRSRRLLALVAVPALAVQTGTRHGACGRGDVRPSGCTLIVQPFVQENPLVRIDGCTL